MALFSIASRGDRCSLANAVSIATNTSARRALHLVATLCLAVACKRTGHLQEVPLHVERIDSGVGPMAPDPAAMARAMAAADAAAQPRPALPVEPLRVPPPQVADAGAPPAVMAPVAVVDAGVAAVAPEPAAPSRRRRRRH